MSRPRSIVPAIRRPGRHLVAAPRSIAAMAGRSILGSTLVAACLVGSASAVPLDDGARLAAPGATVDATQESAPLSGPTDLAHRLERGVAWRFERVTTIDLELDVTVEGRPELGTQQTTQTSVETLRGEVVVLEAEQGRPVRVRVAFGASGRRTTSGAQSIDEAFPLAHRTVLVRVRGTDIVEILPVPGGDAGVAPGAVRPIPELDAEQRRTIVDLVAPERQLLPQGPVTVGDAWTARPEPVEGGLREETTYRLTERTRQPGEDRPRAVLTCDGTITGEDDGLESAGTITGTVEVDVATGLPRETDLAGTMTIAGTSRTNGMTLLLDGRGTLQQRGRVEILQDAGGDPEPFARGSEAEGEGDEPPAGAEPEAAGDRADGPRPQRARRGVERSRGARKRGATVAADAFSDVLRRHRAGGHAQAGRAAPGGGVGPESR